ncbi:MAG: hypothetical protein QME79_13660 [Bacillota bacterium]|nr:hypothetical protein [Bacillota bacterium]
MREVISGLPEDTNLRTYIRYALEALDQLLLTGEQPKLEVAAVSESSVDEDQGFARNRQRANGPNCPSKDNRIRSPRSEPIRRSLGKAQVVTPGLPWQG